MTSQDSARKFPEQSREVDKYLHSKEVTHICDNFIDKIHRISSVKNQIKPPLRSNIPFVTSVDNVGRIVHDQRSEEERNCQSCYSKNCHISNRYLTSQISDSLNGCTGDDLQKQPGSVACSDLDMTDILARENMGNTGQLLRELDIDQVQEKCFQLLEDRNSSSTKGLITSSAEMQFENCTSPSNTVNNDNADKKTIGLNRISQLCKSKSLQPSSTFQKGFILKHHESLQLSNTLGTSPQKSVSSHFDNSPSEQLTLQANCSTMSASPHQLSNTCFSSFDFSSFTSEDMSSNENLHTTTVKSLRKLFGRSQEWQTRTLDEMSVSSSQNTSVSNVRVKKKTSSAIQRIQAQLLLQMENDETKSNNCKPLEKCEREQHPDKDNERQGSCEKGSCANPERLMKQEKPYRQWHRMSRVLTAESRFIISPKLPIHSFLSSSKQNNKVMESREELLNPEEKIIVDTKAVSPDVIEAVNITSNISPPIQPQIEYLPEEKKIDISEESGQENTELPMLVVEETNCNKVSKQMILGSTLLPAMSVNLAQMPHYTNNICSSPENSGTVLSQQEIRQRKTINKNTLIPSQGPSSARAKTLTRSKPLTRSSFHSKLYHKHGEHYASDDDSSDGDIISSGTFDRITPLNSVSGASQVTGPSFREHKKEFIFEVPTKKTIRTGPKLRTAIRSRTRIKSPVLMFDSINAFSGAESQTVLFQEPTNISRKSSSHSRDSMHDFSSERRRDIMPMTRQRARNEPHAACCTGSTQHNNDGPESINRNWSSGNAVTGESQKESFPTNTRKVFLAGVASKLIQTVNRAGLRVPWSDSTKKYQEVQATHDYKGTLPGQLSFRKGQKIKQKSFVDGPSDGMSYGYYRVGRLRKKKKGLFPTNFVTAEVIDGVEGSDIVSLTTSTKSAN